MSGDLYTTREVMTSFFPDSVRTWILHLSDGGECREELGRREEVVPGVADLAGLGAEGETAVLAVEVDSMMILMGRFSGPRQGEKLADLWR